MQNDITSAKNFKDDYFVRLQHGMTEHTVISLMIEYASAVNNSNESSVDVETIIQDNERLKWSLDEHKILYEEKVKLLGYEHDLTLSDKEKEILELKEKILSLESKPIEVAKTEPVTEVKEEVKKTVAKKK